MGLMAFVRSTLIPGEFVDKAPSTLHADRRGALWVVLADAIAGLPAALGRLSAAASMSVALSTEDVALLASLRSFKGFKVPTDGIAVSPPAAALTVYQGGAINFDTFASDGTTPLAAVQITVADGAIIPGPITKVTAVGGGAPLASMLLGY